MSRIVSGIVLRSPRPGRSSARCRPLWSVEWYCQDSAVGFVTAARRPATQRPRPGSPRGKHSQRKSGGRSSRLQVRGGGRGSRRGWSVKHGHQFRDRREELCPVASPCRVIHRLNHVGYRIYIRISPAVPIRRCAIHPIPQVAFRRHLHLVSRFGVTRLYTGNIRDGDNPINPVPELF